MTFAEYLLEPYSITAWPGIITVEADDKDMLAEYFSGSFLTIDVNNSEDYAQWKRYFTRDLLKYYPKYLKDKTALAERFGMDNFYSRTMVTSRESNTDTTGNVKETSNGKSRQFAFEYPESNYQGGTIPYDMADNPDVEFISSQGDALSTADANRDSTGNIKGTGKTELVTSPEYNELLDEILAVKYDNFAVLAEKLEHLFRRIDEV